MRKSTDTASHETSAPRRSESSVEDSLGIRFLFPQVMNLATRRRSRPAMACRRAKYVQGELFARELS
jgi:hypothetical protein